MSELIVMWGGLTTSEEMIDAAGHAAVKAGLGTDVLAVPLPGVRRKLDQIAKHLDGATSIGHSWGNLPPARAIRRGARPRRVIACNGIEPMGVVAMGRRGFAKRTEGRTNPETAAMLAHNKEQFRQYPWANLAALPSMTRFSTFGSLAICQEVGIPTLAVVTTEDIMAPYSPHRNTAGIAVLELAGPHDEMLQHPEDFMQQVAAHLNRV